MRLLAFLPLGIGFVLRVIAEGFLRLGDWIAGPSKTKVVSFVRRRRPPESEILGRVSEDDMADDGDPTRPVSTSFQSTLSKA